MRVMIGDKTWDLPEVGTIVYFLKQWGDRCTIRKSRVDHYRFDGKRIGCYYKQALQNKDYFEVDSPGVCTGSGILDFEIIKKYWEATMHKPLNKTVDQIEWY